MSFFHGYITERSFFPPDRHASPPLFSQQRFALPNIPRLASPKTVVPFVNPFPNEVSAPSNVRRHLATFPKLLSSPSYLHRCFNFPKTAVPFGTLARTPPSLTPCLLFSCLLFPLYTTPHPQRYCRSPQHTQTVGFFVLGQACW